MAPCWRSKNVTGVERFSRTYADGYTVMSGAVHPESGQAGCIHMFPESHKAKIAYFMGIEESDFLRPVFPATS